MTDHIHYIQSHVFDLINYAIMGAVITLCLLKMLNIKTYQPSVNQSIPENPLWDRIQNSYEQLKGYEYSELNSIERRDLYIYVLWKDGASVTVAFNAGMTASETYVDSQLRLTFDYEDNTLII